MADAAASPTFDVQYGPQAVQWCTHDMLEAIAEGSRRTGRRIHMHLLETSTQRAWLDASYPDGIVLFLDEIGFLSPRLTLAHCTWARPDELELLAERGVTIAVNTSSNLSLSSGVSTALDEAVNALIADGVTTVVAAGNANVDSCTRSPARASAAGSALMASCNSAPV